MILIDIVCLLFCCYLQILHIARFLLLLGMLHFLLAFDLVLLFGYILLLILFHHYSRNIHIYIHLVLYYNGIFIVERTGKYGAINEKGMEILKPEYSEMQIK